MSPEPRTIHVVSNEQIGSSMTRLTFRNDPVWPGIAACGADEFCWLSFPTGDNAKESGRYYTIRSRNAARREFVVDFALHNNGIATEWARNARTGDTLRIYPPRFRFEPPADTAWLLLLVDITGLPAAGRILAEAAANLRVIAHIEIATEADRQVLDTKAEASLNWHIRDHRRADHPSHTELPRIARTITELPDGPGYIYIAGEATAVSESRKYFRDALGFDKNRITAIGYWIAGQARG